MTIGKKEVTFKWSNYMKPTPSNLERNANLLMGILGTASGIAQVQNYPIAGIVFAFSIGVLQQFVKFFAAVNHEEERNQPPTV